MFVQSGKNPSNLLGGSWQNYGYTEVNGNSLQCYKRTG